MINITFLSEEVISCILEYVSINDIDNFALTCTKMQNLIDNNNYLWRKKCFIEWPYLLKTIDDQGTTTNIDFQKLVKTNIRIKRLILRYLSNMSKLHYYKEDLAPEDMADLNALFGLMTDTYKMSYYFLATELIIIQGNVREKHNLTDKYYATKVLSHLRYICMPYMWNNFINSEKEEQTLEWAAVFMSQRCQIDETVYYRDVSVKLDNIAQMVLNNLKKIYSGHPIFSVSNKQLKYWKKNNFSYNQFDPVESRQILETICDVMFNELGYIVTNPFRSMYKGQVFIEQTLISKYGHPTIVAIIFESVARRLGVHCVILTNILPNFIRWDPKINNDIYATNDSIYIDLRTGKIVNETERKANMIYENEYLAEGTLQPSPPIKIILDLLYNLNIIIKLHRSYHWMTEEQRPLLELQVMLEPNNVGRFVELSWFYLSRKLDITPLVLATERIRDSDLDSSNAGLNILSRGELRKVYEKSLTIIPNTPMSPKTRSSRIKYAIGMVMTYKRSGAHFMGTITGWDPQYVPRRKNENNTLFSPIAVALQDYVLMNNFNLDQPFYSIFDEEGEMYYVSQDALSICLPMFFENYRLGRFFSNYPGTHYEPNTVLATLYPQDAQVREKFLNTQLRFYVISN